MKKKQLVGLALSFCMLFAFAVQAYAANAELAKAENSAFERFVSADFVSSDTRGDKVTRGAFAQLINKVIVQEETSDGITAYTDVTVDSPYYIELARALSAGYMAGTSAVTMEPNSYITREQAAVIMSRICDAPAADTAILALYTDVGSVASWAKAGMATMLKSGALSASGGLLNPKAVITYGEAALLIDAVINDLLPLGRVIIAGTVYEYGADVTGTKLGSSNIYYAPMGTALSGTLYGEKDMSFGEFWYGELNKVTDATSAQSAEYLNYSNSKKTEDIYEGVQKNTWDNDSGMYDAITRATVGYGIYRAAFVHNVELTRDDGTKELYGHDI